MKKPIQKVDIAPVLDLIPSQLEEAITLLCRSVAVQKARISTRAGFKVTDLATGETMRWNGPALVLVVNERMLKQGW